MLEGLTGDYKAVPVNKRERIRGFFAGARWDDATAAPLAVQWRVSQYRPGSDRMLGQTAGDKDRDELEAVRSSVDFDGWDPVSGGLRFNDRAGHSIGCRRVSGGL